MWCLLNVHSFHQFSIPNGQIPFEMLAVLISTRFIVSQLPLDPILISFHITFRYFLAFLFEGPGFFFSHLPDLDHHFVACPPWLLGPALAAGTSLGDSKAGQS